jgi:hypothetical protein
MDYPGNLYFFLKNFVSDYWILYSFTEIISLLILALCCLPWLKTRQPSDTSLIRIIHSSPFFLFLISVFILLMRIPSLLLDEQNIDESLWIAGSSAFFQSPRLWTSFDTTTSGPLVMLPLILIKLTGMELNYTSARLGGILFCIIPAILCSYYTFRILLEEKISRILALILAAFFAFANMPYDVAYNGEHEIIVFTSMAILFHTKLLMGNKRQALLFIYGVIIGCLPFTKLQATPLGIFLGLSMLVFLMRSKVRPFSYLLFFAGTVLPFLIILLWILLAGEFKDFWIPYIVNNLSYGQGETGPGSSWLYFRYFVYLLRTLPDSRFYFTTILGFAFLLGAILFFLKKIRERHIFLLISAAGLLLSSYYAIVKTSFFYPHYFLIAIIPAVFFLSIIVWISNDAFHQSPAYKILMVIFSFLFIAIFSIDGLNRLANNPEPAKAALQKTPAAQTIGKYKKGNERMAIWGWNAALYVQTGMNPGTRYGDCYHQLKKSGLQEYYLNTYLKDLQKNKPAIFVDAITPDAYEFNSSEYKHQNFSVISNYVKANYKKAEEVDGIEIFIRKTE